MFQLVYFFVVFASISLLVGVWAQTDNGVFSLDECVTVNPLGTGCLSLSARTCGRIDIDLNVTLNELLVVQESYTDITKQKFCQAQGPICQLCLETSTASHPLIIEPGYISICPAFVTTCGPITETVPLTCVESGVRCQTHSTCQECAAQDACGWCPTGIMPSSSSSSSSSSFATVEVAAPTPASKGVCMRRGRNNSPYCSLCNGSFLTSTATCPKPPPTAPPSGKASSSFASTTTGIVVISITVSVFVIFLISVILFFLFRHYFLKRGGGYSVQSADDGTVLASVARVTTSSISSGGGAVAAASSNANKSYQPPSLKDHEVPLFSATNINEPSSTINNNSSINDV